MPQSLFSSWQWRAVAAFAMACVAFVARAEDLLASGFQSPPPAARTRAYWWWLNGNVTKESITRDLEQMQAKGFGGALICDADGSSQDGNERAPHGPTFFTPEWRELYRHTVREAARLGLELSLNIQSGWNLGGPMITPEDAAKKLVWSEIIIEGPTNLVRELPEPKARDNYYRDLFVVAHPLAAPPGNREPTAKTMIGASGEQPEHPATDAIDGNGNTFWVSTARGSGDGPTPEKPAWLQVSFPKSTRADSLMIRPRDGYGPRQCELTASDDGSTFTSILRFEAPQHGPISQGFAPVAARYFRLVISSAFDPRSPAGARNAQIAEFEIYSGDRALIPREKSSGKSGATSAIQNWEQKAMLRTLHFSAPDSTPLLVDQPARPGEEETRHDEVIELTSHLSEKGLLNWVVPKGRWRLLRFGSTIGDSAKVSTCSEGWNGYALDVLDEAAFRRYWDAVIEPLIADAGSEAGKTLKYLHTDSWEVEAINWTPTLRKEFKKRRGYDLVSYLPVIAGHIVDSRPASNRFLNDFRRTLGDLAVDHHYRPFLKWAHQHGLGIHPESGGPHAVPIDAQRCLGQDDVPMSEFWAWSWTHRIGDSNRFFVKQPASAAHTYGKPLVAAEGFTTIGPHWQETLWDNLKPAFDHACMEGLNRLVWHAFVCSPESAGIPGQQYFAGTHLNPNVTWWEKSAPFFAYLNRCQFMLQRGLPVADALYYYGDHVPNFAQIRASDPAKVGTGYDYDVITEEALLSRVSVKDSRLTLPEGTSYRVLAIPERAGISPAVLRKLKTLVSAGATIVGRKPEYSTSLQDFPACDVEVKQLADELWDGTATRHITTGTARQALAAAGALPDFEFRGTNGESGIEYIHRRDGDTEIYFVTSRELRPQSIRCTFRVSGKVPELWDAMSGGRRIATEYERKDGRTVVPLELGPYGSVFVVFREPDSGHPPTGKPNFPVFITRTEIKPPWTVSFDPRWGGPVSAEFTKLESWTTRDEQGIRYYSGTATYKTTLNLPENSSLSELYLDLGSVKELAEVRLNGKALGIVWAPPFRVGIGDVARAGWNTLEVEVVNFWPNRIIGDQWLPPGERFTKTNIRKLTKDTKLMESGLLGPVRILKKSN